jgi:hypothetical protein
MLIGLGKMIKKIVEVVESALTTLLYTYTTTGTPGTQGGSYYTTYVGSESAGYAMLTNNGKAFYTLDLTGEWTEANQEIGDWGWRSPQYIQQLGMFFAHSQYGRTAYSYDGLNWTAGTRLFPNNGFARTGVRYENGIFVAVNSQEGATAYSVDGLSWTYNSQSLRSLAGTLVNMEYGFSFNTNIAFGAGKFVITGEYSVIAYSSDGMTWSAIDSEKGMNSHTNVIFLENQFLIPLIDGGLMSSWDGSTWSYSSAFPAYVRDIVYRNGYYIGIPNAGWGSDTNKFVRAGASLSSMSTVFTFSGDTPVSINAGDHSFNDLRAIILSDSGKVYYSSNSNYTSWTEGLQLAGTPYILNTGVRSASPLSYFDGTYIMTIGYLADTYYGQVFTSADGITWSYKTLSSDFGASVLWPWAPEPGTISTLREVQTVIGGQGEEGSFVESLLPVKLIDIREIVEANIGYPNNNNVAVFKVTIKNTGTTPEYITMGISYDGGVSINTSNLGQYFEDVLVPAGETITIPSTDYINAQTSSANSLFYMVSGTAADVLEFKVYDWSGQL